MAEENDFFAKKGVGYYVTIDFVQALLDYLDPSKEQDLAEATNKAAAMQDLGAEAQKNANEYKGKKLHDFKLLLRTFGHTINRVLNSLFFAVLGEITATVKEYALKAGVWIKKNWGKFLLILVLILAGAAVLDFATGSKGWNYLCGLFSS